MTRPIAVDLFSGAGGMSLGFEQAGFDVVACVEIDPVHAAIHAFNFPQCAVLCGDISTISGAAIRLKSGIGPKKVNLVIGGAPCQGFSLIGQRAMDDPRNSLVREYQRVVLELDADYFVFENVKGLTLGPHKAFLTELIDSFRSVGYAVQSPWQVLNASDYGVPQSRERLILFGAKIGLPLPEYPHQLQKQITCAEALGDLPDAEKYDALWETDEVRAKKNDWKKESAYASEMRCRDDANWHYSHPRIWDTAVLTGSMRTEHTKISRRRFAAAPEGQAQAISRLFKLPRNGLSNTLRAGTDAARGAFTSPRPIHYQYPRCVTVREMARLHGFPDWFRLHRTKWHGARQIGNAVPPPLARAAGDAVADAMKLRRRRPQKAVTLGSPRLLQMTVQEASRYWNVTPPAGKRDRKSGQKKRTQLETQRDERLVAAE